MPPLQNEADEPFFEKWLIGATEDFEAFLFLVLTALDDGARPRKRSRKRADLDRHLVVVSAVTANLAYWIVAKHHTSRIAVPLGKRKEAPRAPDGKELGSPRYDRPGFRSLSAVVHNLERASILILKKSNRRGAVSTIEPTSWFKTIVHDAKLTLSDFRRDPDEETVILSRSNWDYPAGIKRRQWIEYQESEETTRYRNEMALINGHLETANLMWMEMTDRPPDLGNRRLRRFFNMPPWQPRTQTVFEFGARVFGGFWLGLHHVSRPFLWIDGEPIADLDFRNQFLRLAYSHAGLPQPSPREDLYSLPSFERYREGIKKIASAMLFARKRLLRLPKKTKELLPKGATASAVRSSILGRHPDLADTFETGMGYSLMFTESQILVAVLRSLNKAGITALPMHDGIMVPRSKAVIALMTMVGVARRQTGHFLPVEEK